MRVAKFLMAAAAASLAVAPAMAAPAAGMSVAGATRAATPAKDGDSQFIGGFIVPIVVVIAVGVGIYFAVDNNDDSPDSP